MARLSAADWLGLAAAPTFAAMGLLTAIFGDDAHHASALTGMALMYLLMSAFHSAPWLKLISARRRLAAADRRRDDAIEPVHPLRPQPRGSAAPAAASGGSSI